MIDENLLFNEALIARENSYSPYSKFKVGACALLKNGKIYRGCNIENSSYGLSNCAERTTLFKLYSDGYNKNDVVAFAIIGSTEGPISPCGACRQVMSELLNLDCPVYLFNLDHKLKKTTVSELLPYSFSKEDL